MTQPRLYPVEEAIKAQKSLRDAAGLGPEEFPLEAFVGMISDEIESLRKRGRSDDEIATIIQRSSAIEITGAEIAENFVSADRRHPRDE